MFIAQDQRQVSRIELADGGGLAPLRDDKADESSHPDADGRIRTAGRTFVRILKTPDPEVRLSLANASPVSATDSCLQWKEGMSVRCQGRDEADRVEIRLHARGQNSDQSRCRDCPRTTAMASLRRTYSGKMTRPR